jgi:hypothetical protein|eukprot:COSAG06_NODE_3253_length_5611_cov_4.103229_2_plen_69_part_00
MRGWTLTAATAQEKWDGLPAAFGGREGRVAQEMDGIARGENGTKPGRKKREVSERMLSLARVVPSDVM